MGTESLKGAAESKSNGDPAPEVNLWEEIAGLPCQLSVALPVAGFKVRNLLALAADTVVDSQHKATDPVPAWVNGVRVGEAEFDVLGTRLAIRIDVLA